MSSITPLLSTHLRSWSAEDPGGWGWLLDQARAADEAGIDRIVVSDHVVYGEHLDAYANPAVGGSEGGKQPTGPDGQWLDPLTLLAVIAGQTQRVRLGTSILLAALRRPAVLAKSAATLDQLSVGRLDLGVGVGWQREEYEACGLDFDTRGKLLDRCLDVCTTLWREPVADFDDGELRFERIHMQPKPLQAGGVPLWISGTVNKPVARRLARFGAGWIPWGADARDLATSIPRLREAVAEAGGPSTFGVQGSLSPVRNADGSLDIARTMEPVPALVAAGVTDVRLPVSFGSSVAESVAMIAPVVEAFRELTG